MDVPIDEECPVDETNVDKTYKHEPQKETKVHTTDSLDMSPDVLQVAQKTECGIEGVQPFTEPGKTMHDPELLVPFNESTLNSKVDCLQAGHVDYTYAYGHFEKEGRKRLP